MKRLIFVSLFLIVPVLFAFSQDKDIIQKNEHNAQPVKIILKEVQCPDCQGFGWIIGLNYLKSSAVKDRFNNSPGVSNPSKVAELSRMVCPFCGGRKTVFIEYKVY